MGIAPNLGAVLSYLVFLPPITPIIVLLLEKEDRFIRFHAWQSLFLGIVCLLSIFGLETLATAVSFFSHPLEVMLNSIMLGVSGLAFGLWLMLLIRSFQGIAMKLPIIGDEAARRVQED